MDAMADVLHLDGNEWLTRAEMAARLDVSERTVTRMVDRGELIRKDNPDGRGKLYRRPTEETGDAGQDARHETGQDNTLDSPPSPQGDDDTRHAGQDTRQDTTRDSLVSRLVDRLEGRNERIAELEAEAGKLRAGLETASDYVEDLEARLDAERTRAEQLRKRLRRLRDQRDAARRERDDARHQIDDLADTVERLRREREGRRTILTLGPLEVSWRE